MRAEPSNRLLRQTASPDNPGDRQMSDKGLLRVGIIGTIVAALCCFTPVLVVLLGALGLAAVIGWLDLVLFPILAFFLAITGYALWKRQQARSS
jgi:mercuric ion transport protein